MKSRSIMRCMLLILPMILLISLILINPVKIYADVGGGISPRFDPILVVGQVDNLSHTGIGAITESDAQTGCDIKITKVQLIPSCGALGVGTCTVPDPGVITIHDANGVSIAAEGIAFNAQCTGAGVPFGCCGGPGTGNCNGCIGSQWKAQLTNAALGLYEFTPTADVILVAPNDTTPPSGCVLSFGIDVIKEPTIDSIPATPAVKDTSRIAFWEGLTLNCPNSGGNSFPASGTGTGASQVVAPCINIDKTCDSLSKEGDDVNYTITVTNCSPAGIPSLNCTITDSLLPNPPFPKQVTLASGANNVTPVLYTVPVGKYPGPLVNTATVSCTLVGFPSVSVGPKVDSCSVNLFKPCVDVTCEPDNMEVEVNDTVNYKVTVNNCIECQNCPPGILLPSLNCNITDTPDPILTTFPKSNVIIAPGITNQKVYNENRTYQSADPNPLTNTVTANCTVVGFGNQKVDSDTCSVMESPPPPPPDSGPEEPYKAAVNDDKQIPEFYISPKLNQFTHPETNYYQECEDILTWPKDANRIDPKKCEDVGDNNWICQSACSERFDSKTVATQPEVCCTSKTVTDGVPNQNTDLHCPDKSPYNVKTALITHGNGGWYEWVIAVPKKPVGEMNIEIECGVLKPNAWTFSKYESIELCAAETGEPIGAGFCTRVPGGLLNAAALPTLEVIAAPGCQNQNPSFKPFHLTAYKNPSDYKVPNPAKLVNSTSMQVLNGSVGARIALKGCMEKTIMMKWPVDLATNVLGETEANLEAGDLIKVRMVLPTQNTVDVYCSQYSVTIGGIGEPETTETGALSDEDCSCVTDCNWSTK